MMKMRKYLLLFVSIVIVSSAFSQTADEVIQKFLQASGGKEKLQGVKTLQYSQLVKMKSPMGEMEIPVNFYREKNKFFRVQASLQFGPQSLDFFTLISDTAGYVMMPPNPMTGDEGGLKKLLEKDRLQQWSQTEVAGMFTRLVEYASNGSKVELAGTEKVGNEDCHKIILTNTAGPATTYFISRKTNLVVRQDAKGTIAANMSGLGAMLTSFNAVGKADKVEVSVLYSDYKEVDGLQFPTKITVSSPMGETVSEVKDIKVNQPIAAKLYQVQ
jgi:hypothetical protein